MPKAPKVTLISSTKHPVETMIVLWRISRDEPSLGSAEEIAYRRSINPEFDKEMQDYFQELLKLQIPLTTSLSFNFLLENIPVALREQMVRHRVGSHFDDKIGVDILPDIGESSWWSQTMRTKDKGGFFDSGEYRMADSIATREEAKKIYEDTLKAVQDAYNKIQELGVPRQDARDLLPMAMTHAISWTLNMRTLIHVIGKRTCWIFQSETWHPVIEGITTGLRKLDPSFTKLIEPPCLSKGVYGHCPYNHENVRKVERKDPSTPPCPLWIMKEAKDKELALAEMNADPRTPGYLARFTALWGFDPLAVK